ncbi:MAG: membrane protein insertase YidC [Burkholderiaceae bacterium]
MILWIVFGLSLLMLWDKWQQYNGHASMFSPVTESQQPAEDAAKTAARPPAGGDASVPGASALPSAAANGSSAPPAGAAPAERAPGQIVALGNDVLKLDIDTTGGQIQRSQFLEHHEIDDKSKDMVLLDSSAGHTYVAQSGWVGAPQGAFPNHRSPFTVVKAPSGNPDDAEQTLTLAAESGGLRVERTYRLKRGEYLLHVQDMVTNVGEQVLRPTLYMQLTRDGDKPAGQSQFYSTYTGPVIYTDKSKFHKIDFSDIEKKKASFDKTAEDGWIGMIQHYFVTAWLPSDNKTREYYADKVEENLYRVGAKEVVAELAPKASATIETRLLVAPQDQRMLSRIAPGLDLTVDYGWLTVIAKPIYALLAWLHSLVGNWGWAIVLLTIIIKTIFFPLQAASYKSMARMKAVTPRMTAVRERYKDDRVKMNQAMMELYKEEKINPLGGCLPIVVQIPVFIALYWVLLASVEMRNAPWVGWIKDLAAPDPYYILPLVMAGTMFLQTKLNPTPPDPVQAKMMLFMPLIFSVMFFFFPSGLVLYWLVNNIYSIIQQWVITRKIAPNKVLS